MGPSVPVSLQLRGPCPKPHVVQRTSEPSRSTPTAGGNCCHELLEDGEVTPAFGLVLITHCLKLGAHCLWPGCMLLILGLLAALGPSICRPSRQKERLDGVEISLL